MKIYHFFIKYSYLWHRKVYENINNAVLFSLVVRAHFWDSRPCLQGLLQSLFTMFAFYLRPQIQAHLQTVLTPEK